MKRMRFLFSLFALSPMALVLIIPPAPTPPVLDTKSQGDLRPSKSAAVQASTALGIPRDRAFDPSRLVPSYDKLPLSFEINQGQTDKRVRFLSRGRGYTLFLTGDQAVLKSSSEQTSFFRAKTPVALTKQISTLRNVRSTSHSSVHLKLLDANPQAKLVGLEELPGKVNYFIGNDPKRWRTDVPTFAKVKYENIYPGVDLVYYGNQEGRLEYDFVVAPGADPKTIRLAVVSDNESQLEINSGGDLVVKAASGKIHLQKPIVYQEKSPSWTAARYQHRPSLIPSGSVNSRQSPRDDYQVFDGRYVLTADNRVGFEVSGYDRSKPLVIDPVLVYSTYLGGSGFDGAFAIAGWTPRAACT